jgi:hypothetical protein
MNPGLSSFAEDAMRIRFILGAAVLAFTGAGGSIGMSWMVTPSPGATLENADRLRKGMTSGQVERLFDGPARESAELNYHTGRPCQELVWEAAGGEKIRVFFDDGKLDFATVDRGVTEDGVIDNQPLIVDPVEWTLIGFVRHLLCLD